MEHPGRKHLRETIENAQRKYTGPRGSNQKVEIPEDGMSQPSQRESLKNLIYSELSGLMLGVNVTTEIVGAIMPHVDAYAAKISQDTVDDMIERLR